MNRKYISQKYGMRQREHYISSDKTKENTNTYETIEIEPAVNKYVNK